MAVSAPPPTITGLPRRLVQDAIVEEETMLEALERDVFATLVALAEGLRRLVQPPERLIDVPQEPPQRLPTE